MKKITLLFLLLTFNLSSQDLSKIDKIVQLYPVLNSFEELAEKIDTGFNTNLEKAKAAYTWLALNIEYYKKKSLLLEAPEFFVYTDINDFKRRKKIQDEKLIIKTFKTRKAVCEGYALSFKKLCDLLNIENELIKGYVKTIPREIAHLTKNKNHIWNAVKVNGKWILLDVTFGSGYSLNGKWKSKLDNYYFNVNKEEFNQTHYPSEKKWLDYTNQKPLKQFCLKPIFNKVFFISKAELIYPKEGKIIIQKREKIELKLKGIKPKTEISYSYNKNREGKKPTINNYNSFTEIIINSPKKDSELNIYFNNKLALQYKVKVN